MKKKILIGLLMIIILGLFIPVKFRLLDGGTIEYKAILYKVSKVNKIINKNDMIGYAKGIEVEVFGKKIDEEWQELKPIIDNYGFDSMGYKVNDDGIIEFEINWEWLYGKLDDGEYRIIKKINGDRYFSVEFLID